MRWRTHVLLGMSSAWLLALLPGEITSSDIGFLAACAGFGALLPDLDAAESKLKHLDVSGVKPFVLPAVALHQGLGHRGLLHSLLGLGFISAVTLPFSFWWGWESLVAFICGYASHLAADACTRRGIPLLYPKRQRHHLLPHACRFVTGSLAEEVLLPFLATAVVLLLLTHFPLSYPLTSPF